MTRVRDRDRVTSRLARSLERLYAPVDMAAAIARKLERFRGDFQTEPSLPVRDTLRAAAVLVPLVDRAEGMSVLLTLRNASLPHHAGQISFPGGRIEEGDASAAATALRETEEEIGLARDSVEIVGRLDDYITGTGFLVAPIVGLIRPPYALNPDPSEVEAVFEVPLAFFLDPANHRRESRVFNGVERRFYAMPYGDKYIWGATAAMLMNLYDLLRD
ncbi:MAG TPA: CoA pyrophosphatase [Alphaproteobacteria bacterium]|jgi:8-oxo-dGTP pyrophosphatase MutT (NUDIX family)